MFLEKALTYFFIGNPAFESRITLFKIDLVIYRFKLGNTTIVNITYIDQDNDVVRCNKAGIGTSNGIDEAKGLSMNEVVIKILRDIVTSNTALFLCTQQFISSLL